MNYNNVDTIRLTEEDYYRLFKWKENNRPAVRKFHPVLEEGLITIEGRIKQYFKQTDDNIFHEVYIGELFFFELSMKRMEDGKLNLLHHRMNPEVSKKLNYPEDNAYSDAITLHATLMAYMEHFMENKIYVQKQVIPEQNQPSKKKKKGKNQKKKAVIKIRQRIYKVRVGQNTESIKQEKTFNRQTEKWGVRGHWRQLKSGKKIWIKSYTKGLGENKEAKIYEL